MSGKNDKQFLFEVQLNCSPAIKESLPQKMQMEPFTWQRQEHLIM